MISRKRHQSSWYFDNGIFTIDHRVFKWKKTSRNT